MLNGEMKLHLLVVPKVTFEPSALLRTEEISIWNLVQKNCRRD